jgi:hypothetical protein
MEVHTPEERNSNWGWPQNNMAGNTPPGIDWLIEELAANAASLRLTATAALTLGERSLSRGLLHAASALERRAKRLAEETAASGDPQDDKGG